MIDKKILEKYYLRENKSMQEIAELFSYSLHKVAYWMEKHEVKSRSRSEATYVKKHPKGDPFRIKRASTKVEAKLFGLGIGLFLGEGHKRNKVSIRLSNSDPQIIKIFMDFLEKICGVKKEDINFHLMVFNDVNPEKAREIWTKSLNIKPEQIHGKITILKPRGRGTYRHKSDKGVIILQYHNKKLRGIIDEWIEKLI